jgi:hypothetical protein
MDNLTGGSSMSKPVLDVTITTLDEQSNTLKAVFDSGSFYSILREDKVPAGATVVRRKTPRKFRGAARGSQLTVVGELPVVVAIGDRQIDDTVLVSPDLFQEMLVGAGMMQKWDISVITRNGLTEVAVGRDMRDPDLRRWTPSRAALLDAGSRGPDHGPS